MIYSWTLSMNQAKKQKSVFGAFWCVVVVRFKHWHIRTQTSIQGRPFDRGIYQLEYCRSLLFNRTTFSLLLWSLVAVFFFSLTTTYYGKFAQISNLHAIKPNKNVHAARKIHNITENIIYMFEQQQQTTTQPNWKENIYIICIAIDSKRSARAILLDIQIW